MRQPYYVTAEYARETPIDIKTVTLEEIHSCDFSEVSFWLIDMSDQRLGWDILSEIRRDVLPVVYLRPVVFWLGGDDLHSDIVNAAEGNIYAGTLTESVVIEWSEGFNPSTNGSSVYLTPLPAGIQISRSVCCACWQQDVKS